MSTELAAFDNTDVGSMQTQSNLTNNFTSSLPDVGSGLDNPVSGSHLQRYCDNNHLSCDDYALSDLSSNAFRFHTINPH